MADIKNKNELKRRIDLFLDDEIDYSINEVFCKETMRMMKEFIGHASHRIDCADAKIKKAKRTERASAIEEFLEKLSDAYSEHSTIIQLHGVDFDILTVDGAIEIMWDLAEQLKEE